MKRHTKAISAFALTIILSGVVLAAGVGGSLESVLLAAALAVAFSTVMAVDWVQRRRRAV